MCGALRGKPLPGSTRLEGLTTIALVRQSTQDIEEQAICSVHRHLSAMMRADSQPEPSLPELQSVPREQAIEILQRLTDKRDNYDVVGADFGLPGRVVELLATEAARDGHGASAELLRDLLAATDARVEKLLRAAHRDRSLTDEEIERMVGLAAAGVSHHTIGCLFGARVTTVDALVAAPGSRR